MPTFVHTADGSKTVFKCVSSAQPKTARINGAIVTPLGTSANSVTFAAPPAANSIVEIIYGPLNGADPTTIPTAMEQTYSPVITPVVKYMNAGADVVPFTLEANAKLISVYAGGRCTEVTY